MSTGTFFRVLSLTAAAVMAFSGCKKEGPQGPAGPQGPSGPQAKTYDFTLNYVQPSTSKVYFGISDIDADDAVIVYWKDFSLGWYVQLPYTYATNSTTYDVAIWPEIDPSGGVWVNVHRYDYPTTWPWASSAVTMEFRAVHIKSSAMTANPGVNFSNYDEVVKAFGLE